MDGLGDFFSAHPLAVMTAAFILLLLAYFIFKQLLKLALILGLIALAAAAYYYFKDPQKMPDNIRQTIRDTRSQSEKMVETGREAYKKTREIYEKSKGLTKEAEEFIKKKEKKQIEQ